MTVIVGLAEKDKVWIGGDSAAVAGDEISLTARPKVFRRDDFLIGICGSFRMQDILQYHFVLPKHDAGVDVVEFMVRWFIESLREAFKDHGYSEVKDNRETGGDFLVGYRGRLFTIYSDFQVQDGREGYAAIGAGREFALGAMASMTNRTEPSIRVLRALEASGRHCTVVRPPWTVEAV